MALDSVVNLETDTATPVEYSTGVARSLGVA
jgi:hypothetical protein